MEIQRAERLRKVLEDYDRLGIGQQVGFERLHLYSIITHSTAIEGSTVTFEENTLLFEDGILPAGRRMHEQMMNLDLRRAYKVAWEVASARSEITLPLLRALSALVMKNTGTLYRTVNGEYDESKGDFRLQNVSAGRGGRSYLSWEKVEKRSLEFITWLNEQLSHVDELTVDEIYDLSFEAHYRLVTIHPWSDGNGRVARLLMNLVQMEGGVIPSIVRHQNKVQYILSLRSSQEEGSSSPFLAFMADELIDNLERVVEEYQRDLVADVPWSKVREDKPGQTSAPQVTPQVRRLVETLELGEASAAELRRQLGLSDAKSFRLLYLRKAIDEGLVEMTIPDKPNSRNQTYRLTKEGRAFLRNNGRA